MTTSFKQGDIVIIYNHNYHSLVNTGIYVGPKRGSNRHNIEVKYEGSGSTQILTFATDQFRLFSNVED